MITLIDPYTYLEKNHCLIAGFFLYAVFFYPVSSDRINGLKQALQPQQDNVLLYQKQKDSLARQINSLICPIKIAL